MRETGIFDTLQMFSCFASHLCSKIVHQDPGESGDVAQRGAQIVGNGIRKRLQFAIGALQLGCTFGYSVFQIIIQCANLKFGPLFFA